MLCAIRNVFLVFLVMVIISCDSNDIEYKVSLMVQNDYFEDLYDIKIGDEVNIAMLERKAKGSTSSIGEGNYSISMRSESNLIR